MDDTDYALARRLANLNGVPTSERVDAIRTLLAMPDEIEGRGSRVLFIGTNLKRFERFMRRRMKLNVEWVSL